LRRLDAALLSRVAEALSNFEFRHDERDAAAADAD